MTKQSAAKRSLDRQPETDGDRYMVVSKPPSKSGQEVKNFREIALPSGRTVHIVDRDLFNKAISSAFRR